MIFLNIILLFQFFFLKISYGKKVTVNAIAFSQNGGGSLYVPLKNDFNKFSKEKGLDIELEINVFSNLNGTTNVEDYESTLDTVLTKNSTKYDIVFFDHVYSKRYSSYLYNLKELLPKEHINMYMEGIANQTCMIKNRLIGLPVTIDYSVLYSNKELLKKYGQPIPKTWNELLKTAIYIQNREKVLYNNTDLVTYNGLFNSDESGFCSVYEFLYSYRKTKDSPFPKFTSQESINALRTIKNMKNKISSNEIFKGKEDFTLTQLFTGNFLFIKFWYLPGTEYIYGVSLLPGENEEVTASIIGGHNIGISKNTSKLKQTVEVFKYITSKEMQIKHIAMSNNFSPIPSVYNDEEVCKKINCTFYKSIQLIGRPITQSHYDSYVKNFMKYIFEYLYSKNEVSAEKTLKKIEDITNIYHLSLNTDDSSIGLILFISVIILSLLLITSLIYVNKFPLCFEFLPIDFWYLYIIGFVVMLSTFFLTLDYHSSLKCHLNIFLIAIGSTLNIIPILYKLIICFPETNKISEWVKVHRYLFLLFFIGIDIILNYLMTITPYTIKNRTYPDEKRFQGCHLGSKFGSSVLSILFLIKFIILVSILFLIFIEWNIKLLYYDIRFLVIAQYMNFILLIIFSVITSITIKKYILHYCTQIVLVIIYTVTNYALFYGFRIVFGYMKRDLQRMTLKNEFNKHYAQNNKSTSKSSSTRNQSSSNNTSDINLTVKAISYKVIGYHYRTETNSDKSSSNNSSTELPNFRSTQS